MARPLHHHSQAAIATTDCRERRARLLQQKREALFEVMEVMTKAVQFCPTWTTTLATLLLVVVVGTGFLLTRRFSSNSCSSSVVLRYCYRHLWTHRMVSAPGSRVEAAPIASLARQRRWWRPLEEEDAMA